MAKATGSQRAREICNDTEQPPRARSRVAKGRDWLWVDKENVHSAALQNPGSAFSVSVEAFFMSPVAAAVRICEVRA